MKEIYQSEDFKTDIKLSESLDGNYRLMECKKYPNIRFVYVIKRVVKKEFIFWGDNYYYWKGITYSYPLWTPEHGITWETVIPKEWETKYGLNLDYCIFVINAAIEKNNKTEERNKMYEKRSAEFYKRMRGEN